MGADTGIAWTNSTFNPYWGCTKVSPGCDRCYAEVFDKRVGGSHWGKGEPRREFGDKHWNEPLKWERDAANSGKPWRVFCGSMCDVMDDEAPEGSRERLWALIDRTPHLTWLLLTKRPQRYDRYLPASGFEHMNVWLGFTAENQQFYDVRWPHVRAYVQGRPEFTTFCSYEPAIGPLTIVNEHDEAEGEYPDWMICGGESGAGCRAFNGNWATSLMHECLERDVAFFMKQLGGYPNKRDNPDDWIPELRVRQFPERA